MIDLGTVPVGHTLSNATLDVDQMDFLFEELSLAELPVVLAVFPRFDNAAARDSGLQRGRRGLEASGLLPDGRIHDDLERWLRILEQPHWYVSARLFEDGDPQPITRMCLASTDRDSVLAVRRNDLVTLVPVHDNLARHLAVTIGSAEAFVPSSNAGNGVLDINAPTDLLAEALDAAPTDVSGTASRLHQIGLSGGDAATLASAMATCEGRVEITAVVRQHGTRRPAGRPIALFDTRFGRIAATSSTATDGRSWTSLAAGSDRKVTQALAELIDAAERDGP